MLKEKNTLFTIGQFAALHEINKKTLMWYDEIGLLKACLHQRKRLSLLQLSAEYGIRNNFNAAGAECVS